MQKNNGGCDNPLCGKHRDVIQESLSLWLAELGRFCLSESEFKHFAKDERDLRYVMELRDCALQDWRFVYAIMVRRESSERLSDAMCAGVVDRVYEKKRMIFEWFKERGAGNGLFYPKPSQCNHMENVHA